MGKSLVERKIDELNLSWYNSYYWKYQYNLSKEYIVPYLRIIGFEPRGKFICEVGSAEGGVLCAFAEQNAQYCLATDIVESRLNAGRQIASALDLPIEFRCHNIISDELPEHWKDGFDLILLRDVIEHLEKPEVALLKLKDMLKDGGLLYVTFPPYYSPFGGHQHQVQNFFSKIPYLHWLPTPLFTKLIKNGRPADVHEVLRLKTIRLTIRKFLNLVEKVGFEILESEFFLVRPVYKYKFGLKTMKLPGKATMLYLKEVIATEASFVLVKRRLNGTK
ncbi:MAG: class I SAM-dependent methyltransferase [Candidatus Kapaibacteriota bacterium]